MGEVSPLDDEQLNYLVAVMDEAGSMKGILSQSSTLDYLMRHVRFSTGGVCHRVNCV